MADSRNYSKEFLTEFIELYKSFPCLWKTKSKDYMNRSKKNDAYKILIEKWKEIEKTATKEMVKTKINSLRAGFRREAKKIEESKRSGAGLDDIYMPHLWYYDLLLFVKDQEMPRSSVSNIPDDDVENEHSDSDGGEEVQNETEETSDRETEELSSSLQSPLDSRPSSSYGTHRNKPSTSHTSHVTKKRRAKNLEQTDEILTLVGERLRRDNEDQFIIFANNVASKLRTLPRETRLYTEKLINDLLFEAEMGHITKATKIVSLSDSVENSPQVTLNRNASAGSYYYPQDRTYPLQAAHPRMSNSFHAYPFETQEMQPQTQIPTTQTLQIRSPQNNDGISLQQSGNELRETNNLANFLSNFQANQH